jgi:hypothetical protein
MHRLHIFCSTALLAYCCRLAYLHMQDCLPCLLLQACLHVPADADAGVAAYCRHFRRLRLPACAYACAYAARKPVLLMQPVALPCLENVPLQ